MVKASEFTKDTGEAVMIVVGKITHYERDDHSDTTLIYLEGGSTVVVSESVGFVTDAIAEV